MKVQEGYVLKYLNLRVFQSPIGSSVDQTDHIMELVNAWFPTGKFRKVDIPLWTDSTYEKELMDEILFTVDSLRKAEMEYHGNF